MKLKRKIAATSIVIFLFLSVLVPLVQGQVPVNSMVVDDTVYTYIPQKGVLSQTPHTLNDFTNQVIVEFTSEFKGEQTLDFAFGFDTDYISITNVEAWDNISHPGEQPIYGEITDGMIIYDVVNVTQIYDLNGIDIGTYDAVYFYEVWTEGANSSIIVGFDTHITINDTCFEIFWNELGVINYTDKWYWDWGPVEWTESSLLNGKNNFLKNDLRKDPTGIPDLDKVWWLVDHVPFEEGESQKMRVTVDVVPQIGHHEYKYDIFVKDSKDSFKKAFVTGKYVLLDPWILSDWNKKAALQINNTGCETDLYNYVVFANITYQPLMETNFSDLRIINETANITVPYFINDSVDGAWAEIYFNVSYLSPGNWTNDTFYLYWNNSVAPPVSTMTGVFPFFSFDGDLTGWDQTDSWVADKYDFTTTSGYFKTDNAGQSGANYSFPSPLIGTGFELNFKVYYAAGATTNILILGLSPSNVPVLSYIVQAQMTLANDGEISVRKNGYTGTAIADAHTGTVALSTWHDIKVVHSANGSWMISVNGTNQTLLTDTWDTDHQSYDSIYLGANGVGAIDIRFDNITLRTISTPEPDVTLGETETVVPPDLDNPIPPTPTNLQNTTGMWWVNHTWQPGWEGYNWTNDSSIVNNLTFQVGTNETVPTVFQINDTWYLIYTEGKGGKLKGYSWNGTGWIQDFEYLGIMNGLFVSGIGNTSHSVFSINDTWYIVRHNFFTDTWYGNNWNGTGWEINTSIVNGLFNHGTSVVMPFGFEMNDTNYMIVVGDITQEFYGLTWNGTGWENDTAIVNGLPVNVGHQPKITIFYNETWNMIVGEMYGDFIGFSWNGTSWNNNSDIVTGLSVTGWGGSSYPRPAPTVFEINSTWYLIAGEYYGNFYGYNWTSNVTDSYNVSVTNNTGSYWYNGTTDLFMNTTTIANGWVNITIWGYNTTIGNISLSSISQNTQVTRAWEVWMADELDGTYLRNFWVLINDINRSDDDLNFYIEFAEGEIEYNVQYPINYGREAYDGYTYHGRNSLITLTEQTNTTLYVLKEEDGAVITFHVRDGDGFAMEGAVVTALTGDVTIDYGTTDSTGSAYLFLSQSASYTITIEKSEYNTLAFVLIPTLTDYYFILTTLTSPEAPTTGTTWQFYPKYTSVKNDSSVIFMLNASSPYEEIEYWSMRIDNTTHTLFNETNETATGGSIIADLDLSEYVDGDELYVTVTLKKFGEEPLILRQSPFTTFQIFSFDVSDTSLLTILSDVGDSLGDFGKNFLALTLTLLFGAMASKFSTGYGTGILCLIFIAFFGVVGWVNIWLLMLAGIASLSLFLWHRGGD